MGSILLIEGWLQIVDLRMLKELWGPIFKMMQKSGGAAQKTAARINASSINDFVKHIPHPLVIQMTTSDSPEGEVPQFGPTSLYAWGVLEPDDLVGSADALPLMNGGWVPGKYCMIAVLDVGANAGCSPS